MFRTPGPADSQDAGTLFFHAIFICTMQFGRWLVTPVRACVPIAMWMADLISHAQHHSADYAHLFLRRLSVRRAACYHADGHLSKHLDLL
ncbi:hypothetical protein ElyMa_003041200 [Elysia marginata]|uniref:Fatty acid hydroxylase domain-containing protein n=1 Tax=Elysia marginata TaxID=1093978 RepID=A0AAV4IHM1_9GAST|nr:hypothetical protein ElyMa_003041200 [Elysia marginata]